MFHNLAGFFTLIDYLLMTKCTKCHIDKPPIKFYTYWHSTQQKTRTRKICMDCTNEQKKEYRLNKKMLAQLTINPDLIYQNNPNYKKCTNCITWKTLDQYYQYKNKAFTKCMECERQQSRKEAKERLEENGGSLRIKVNPNEYVDEYQRKNVFELMTLLGYLFNEENGIWYKEPWKTKDGKFPLIKPPTRKIVKTNIPKEVKKKIIEYRLKNYTIGKISAVLNVSETSVWKICQNISK